MSAALDDIKLKFQPWIIESLKKENMKDVQVEITGMSEKGDNYLGDVIFMDVKGIDPEGKPEGKPKMMSLVMKKGKDSKLLRDTWSVNLYYLRENILYERIFPAFQTFQLERNVKDMFDSYPKCYGTLALDASEAILLEDLKKSGYSLHDRFVNMDVDHIKLVLYTYAKFHAISFAMRDQDKTQFEKLTHDFTFVVQTMLVQDSLAPWYEKQEVKVADIVRERDPILAEVFLKKIEKGLMKMLLEIGEARVEESVITHGDCWNNNFMFRYKDETKTTPTEVSILDWQLSCVHSPVLDLSYFLYIVSSTEQASKFDQLIRFYHKSLSDFIRRLGSDPEKLFPFTTLSEHWEKYSSYGLNFLVSSLEAMTCDKKDAIGIDEYENSDDALAAWDNVRPKNYESYKERVFANVKHFCEGVKT